ncbi:MAG: carboxylate--amine ligase [Acidiferrobacterales bacterium]
MKPTQTTDTRPGVLVLDGNQRSALAATRSLGHRGVPVTVADEARQSLAGSSRYCGGRFSYPSPAERPDDFLQAVQRNAAARAVRVILPMTEVSASLLVRNRERFAPAVIPLPDADSWDQISDKCSLLQMAQQLQIPAPTTLFPENADELVTAAESIGYPVVLKPCRSKVWNHNHCTSTAVHVVRDPSELGTLTAAHGYLRDFPLAVQAHVPGSGLGVFALYDHGKAVTFFAHRRIREKPPHGGVSVLSESISVRADLQTYAARLLDHARWHGVAMVEFRGTEDGIPYLMEINPRFWGSLQLAIDSGVDFPGLLYDLAVGNTPEPPSTYRIGIRTRWLLGDLDRLYLVLRNRETGESGTSRLREILRFLNFGDRQTHFEVNRLGDMRPFFFELRRYLGQLIF